MLQTITSCQVHVIGGRPCHANPESLLELNLESLSLGASVTFFKGCVDEVGVCYVLLSK